MATIEAKNPSRYSRRDFIFKTSKAVSFTVAGKALGLFFPIPEQPLKPKFIPLWVEKGYPHLKLKENGPLIEKISKGFNIDPHILLALLIMESPDEISISYAGAQGAYQITPRTRGDLVTKISQSAGLEHKRESLGVKTADLKNPNVFKGQVFLACVYLEDERVAIPKGQIVPFTSGYFGNLYSIKRAAIKYHDGPNCNALAPSEHGQIAGDRVVEIFQVLKGSKSFNEVSEDVASFLGIRN